MNEIDPESLENSMGRGYSKIDYSKPIFVLYIKTTDSSRARAEEIINRYAQDLNSSGAQIWYIASDRTEMQCIYHP